MHGGRAEKGMTRPGLQVATQGLKGAQELAHLHDRVHSFFESRAMGSDPAGLNIEPNESLMTGCDLKRGWLGDDGSVSLKSGRERFRSEAREFLVDDTGEDHRTFKLAFCCCRSREHECGKATFRIHGTPAKESAALDSGREGLVHSGYADSVQVCIEDDRATRSASARDSDDIGPSGCHVFKGRLNPVSLEPVRDEPRQLGLTGPTRDQGRID